MEDLSGTSSTETSSLQSSARVLVIDDDADICELVTDTAHRLGMECSATTGEAVLEDATAPGVSMIFLDLLMPQVDGIEVLRHLGAMKSQAGIVVMSGIGSRVVESALDLAGVLGLRILGSLQKPFRIPELESLFRAIPNADKPRARLEKDRAILSREDLELAMEEGQFVLHYQPQVEIATGILTGFEALVRWNHPVQGLVFPDHFIPLTEKANLIDRLGWIVLEKALKDKQAYREHMRPSMKISVNLAAKSLQDLRFPEMLSVLLQQYGVQPEELVLEITESGFVEDLSRSLDVLSRLRMRGIQLSIDDFGTGYSMMRQLRSIPATELKIDKAFVAGMDVKTSDRIMVQKTIEIGHELGMIVVAEGVETAQQLEALLREECDVAQGYFFSRPMPIALLPGWIAGHGVHERTAAPG